MALGAVLAAELALVRVWIMAVGAEIMRDGPLEIAALVAIETGSFRMGAVQREIGFVVVETDG